MKKEKDKNKKEAPEEVRIIAENIKQCRERERLSQGELGVALGINPQFAQQRISAYEKTLRSPSKKLLAKIAKYFGLSVPWFQTRHTYHDIDTERALLQINESLAPYGAEAIKRINKMLPGLVNLIEDKKDTSVSEQAATRKKTA